MGWVGEYFEGKSLTITLWNCIGKKWLEKKHNWSNWWRTQELNKKWSGIKRFGEDIIAT